MRHRLMRRRFLAMSIMVLIAAYLLLGGLAYHGMDEPHRNFANRYDASSSSTLAMIEAVAAGLVMPEKTIRPVKRVILFNYYFQRSIAAPVIIGGIAFWVWFNAHRRLRSYVSGRSTATKETSSLLCPECGASIPYIPEETPAAARAASFDGSAVASTTSRRIGGALLLASIGFLVFGGVFRLALPTIAEAFGSVSLSSPHISGMTENTSLDALVGYMQISDPGLRHADVEFTYRLVQIDRMFRSSVFLAAVASLVGFILWKPWRERPSKPTDQCPYCSYGLPAFTP